MEGKLPLIVTKVLIPNKRPGLLHRPRLVNFIHEHIDRRLILISASAGYGKTSLLIDYIHDTDLPVCWYSLDESDQDPRVFLEYFVAAVRQRFPQFGQKTQKFLTSISAGVRPILSTLVNELYEDIPDYFVVVLDDYQLVNESQAINTLMDFLF